MPGAFRGLERDGKFCTARFEPSKGQKKLAQGVSSPRRISKLSREAFRALERTENFCGTCVEPSKRSGPFPGPLSSPRKGLKLLCALFREDSVRETAGSPRKKGRAKRPARDLPIRQVRDRTTRCLGRVRPQEGWGGAAPRHPRPPPPAATRARGPRGASPGRARGRHRLARPPPAPQGASPPS